VAAITVAFPLLFVVALGGCSGSNTKGNSVSGKVTYNNAPVTGGTLKFHPAAGGEAVLVTISPNGTFFVEGSVPTGQATVTVETESVNQKGRSPDYTKMGQGREGFKPPEGGSGAPVYVKIPTKYNDPKTSNLSVEVKKGKNEGMDFDLKD
jgi:hypothetical protein